MHDVLGTAVSQQPIPVVYENVRIDTGIKADRVVEDRLSSNQIR